MKPLFEDSEDHVRPLRARSTGPLADSAADTPDLSKYFRVDAPDAQLDSLAERLRALDTVEAAYIKPPTYAATATMSPGSYTMPEVGTKAPINDMLPAMGEAPPATPDFTARQGYLLAAPGGIDAVFSATQPGGRGAGVRIIDIEGAWRFTHEDLTQNQGGVVGGTPSTDIGWRNHGTAVMGEFGGDFNGAGVTGICPDANTRAISIFNNGSAWAIRRAADLLNPGDIILIELHRPGPHATGIGQEGFIAVEWWPDDFDAIRYATGRGVIVVEAAGNGAENLDDPLYNTPDPGFPATWANPFRRGARDSGAILVGAGAPPPGTHGHNYGPDRSRLDFSNYGAALDAQGWGREVTTTGYGDLQGGSNEDFWYTDQFSGTSSASPIVVGALGCAQGSRRARSVALLTPATARQLLRTAGSPQQDAPSRPATQRIGMRPDLRRMIGVAPPVALSTSLFRYWNPSATDHFYTTNWSELGSGRYGWQLEGVQCFIFPQAAANTVPLHRYWNPTIADHFYTTNWTELGGGRYGWGYEGIAGYVYNAPAANRVPLYRYWNPNVGDHFYTTNWNELGAGRNGYRFEGIQCYVATVQRPPSEAPSALKTEELTEENAPKLVDTAPTGNSFSVNGAGSADVDDGTPASFATSSELTQGSVPSSFAVAEGATNVSTSSSFETKVTAGAPTKSEEVSITIRVRGKDSAE